MKNKKIIWNTPFFINDFKVKNRIVFPPITTNWANDDGSASKKNLIFYEKIAKGGCGMIVVEGTAISKEGKTTTNCLCLYNKSQIKGIEKIAKTIQNENCLGSLQLNHAGGQANPNFTKNIPVSPSGLHCKSTSFDSKKLSLKEIKLIRKNFVNSSELASKAGFSSVEIHLAHGYLLHEFISKHTNKRTDFYGGNLENRLRLPIEIISEIKDKFDLTVGVRISGEDYLNEGINNSLNKIILPVLQTKGVDYFSVTAGIYETSQNKHKAMERGDFFHYSKYVKDIVDKPVIGVGKILTLNQAKEHLKNNDCDLVAIGRGLIADPYMVKKFLSGKKHNACTECDQCAYLRFGKNELDCSINKNE